jgi:hypothetical protein
MAQVLPQRFALVLIVFGLDGGLRPLLLSSG